MRLGPLLLLSVILFAMMITGCGQGEINVEQEGINVELTLNTDSVTPEDELKLFLINRGRSTVYFGEEYIIEHYVDGDWQPVPLPNGGVWVTIGYGLKPGKKFEQTIKLGPSEPGRYRVVKRVRSSQSLEDPIIRMLNAEFTVER